MAVSSVLISHSLISSQIFPLSPLQVCLTLSKFSSFLNSFTERFCDLPVWPCLFRPGKHSLVPLSFLSLSCRTLLSKRTHWANGHTRSEGEPSQSHKCVSRSLLLSEGKAGSPSLPRASDFRFETLLGLFSLSCYSGVFSSLQVWDPLHALCLLHGFLPFPLLTHAPSSLLSLFKHSPSKFKGSPAALHLCFRLQSALHSCLSSVSLLQIKHALQSMAGPEILSNLYRVSQLAPALF